MEKWCCCSKLASKSADLKLPLMTSLARCLNKETPERDRCMSWRTNHREFARHDSPTGPVTLNPTTNSRINNHFSTKATSVAPKKQSSSSWTHQWWKSPQASPSHRHVQFSSLQFLQLSHIHSCTPPFLSTSPSLFPSL